jgi:transcriptional regulator with GAF, ATPase, and Fis domain
VNSATLPPSADRHRSRDASAVPGVAVVFTGGAPSAEVHPVPAGGLELGRGDDGDGKINDGRVSRRHAQVGFEAGHCTVTDLGSQNGTFVDGRLAAPHAPAPAQRVIRVGDSLLIPLSDIRPLQRWGVATVDGFVRGPAMQALIEDAARAAHTSSTLHIRGETGAGKEGIAQAFHRASPRAARALIAVNCAAIPHAIAERLLFGARRGAYSGADADAPGYLQEADGSTLFLDEVAELDLQVQAKLLRVLESREVLALGASKPRKVDFALCSATNKDLRALVATGSLREDLYFRIGRPAVTLPALRNRPEEIPALIAQELARLSPAPTAHVSLVEQCLLRPWPGNVRELFAELRAAAQAAVGDGTRIEARHLPLTAGTLFGNAMPEGRAAALDPRPSPPVPVPHPTPPAPPASSTLPVPEEPKKRMARDDPAWRHRIEDALRTHSGNVAATARALGLHRTQLRRLVERHGIAIDPAGDPRDPGDSDPGDGDADDAAD